MQNSFKIGPTLIMIGVRGKSEAIILILAWLKCYLKTLPCFYLFDNELIVNKYTDSYLIYLSLDGEPIRIE